MLITKKNIRDFNNNKLIQNLGNKPVWTVTKLFSDGKKLPLDAGQLVNEGKVTAWKSQGEGFHPAPGTLMTLDELAKSERLYGANRTLLVNTMEQDIIALDIESDTTKETVDAFVNNLPVFYLENSVSGGFHALIPLSQEIKSKYADTFKENVLFQRKLIVQYGSQEFPDSFLNLKDLNWGLEEKLGLGTVEFFFKSHFITLTRSTLPVPIYSKPHSPEEISQMYANLDKLLALITGINGGQSRIQGTHGIVSGNNIPKLSKLISDSLSDEAMDSFFAMSPIDYPDHTSNGLSRYENAVVYKVANAIKSAFLDKSNPEMVMLTKKQYKDLTLDEFAYAIYLTVIKVVDHRKKHDTKRRGMPYLLYLSANCVARMRAEEAEFLKKRQAQVN